MKNVIEPQQYYGLPNQLNNFLTLKRFEKDWSKKASHKLEIDFYQ